MGAFKRGQKFIQGMGLKKGALHKELGIPESQKIPLDTLQEASKNPGKLGKRARLALTFRKFK